MLEMLATEATIAGIGRIGFGTSTAHLSSKVGLVCGELGMDKEKPRELHEYSPVLALMWRLIRVFPSVRKAQDRERSREEKKR